MLEDPLWTILGTMDCTVLVGLLVFSTASFYRHKSEAIIRSRGFWTTVLPVLFLTVQGFWSNLSLILKNEMSCREVHLVPYAAGNACLAFIAERMLLVFLHFRISSFARLYGERVVERTAARNGNDRRTSKLSVRPSGVEGQFDFSEEEMVMLSRDMRISRWLFNHRTWFHHGLFSKSKLAALALSLLLTVPAIIFFWDHGRTSGITGECREINRTAGLYSLGLVLGLLLTLVFLGREVSKIPENFLINDEISKGKVILICNVSFRILMLLNLFDLRSTTIMVSIFANTVTPVWLMYISLIDIVRHAKQRKRAQLIVEEQENDLKTTEKTKVQSVVLSSTKSATAERSRWNEALGSSQATLQDKLFVVLDNPELLQHFTAFLTQEFSVENVLFVVAVRKFNRDFYEMSEDQRQRRARKIYREFCAPDAKLQINVTHDSRKKLQALLKETASTAAAAGDAIPADVFQPCYLQIIHLMSSDCLPRFLTSAMFMQLVVQQTVLVREQD